MFDLATSRSRRPRHRQGLTSFECRLVPVVVMLVLTAVVARAQPPRDAAEVKLIAHRGGVVEDGLIENQLPALNAAVKRGYWMVEVDVRESKDGHLVVQHDPNFKRYYGDPRQVGEMTWGEIRQLRSRESGLRPLEFAEYAKACRGRMRVMIDTKEPSHDKRFYEAMERALKENQLLHDALLIGTREAKAYFKGKARVAVNRKELQAAISGQEQEDVGRLYFLFEHGRVLDEPTVRLARQHGVPVVPSINVFHYLGRKNQRQRAEADLQRLRDLGVEYFQIDSVYDRVLRGK